MPSSRCADEGRAGDASLCNEGAARMEITVVMKVPEKVMEARGTPESLGEK
jgi:hypothetical protein